jgi:hypothetical protein
MYKTALLYNYYRKTIVLFAILPNACAMWIITLKASKTIFTENKH